MGPLLLLLGVGLLVAMSLSTVTREKLEPTLFIQQPPHNDAEVDRIFEMAGPQLIAVLKEEEGFDQTESDAIRQEVIDKVPANRKTVNARTRLMNFKRKAIKPIADFYTTYKNADWPIAEADINAYVEQNYTTLTGAQTVEKTRIRNSLLKTWLKAYYSDQLYREDSCKVNTAGRENVTDAVAGGTTTPVSPALTGIAKLYDDYRRAYTEYRVTGDPAQRKAYEALKIAIETELENKRTGIQSSDKYLRNFADTYQALPEMEEIEKKASEIQREGKKMENELAVSANLGKEIPIDYTPYYVKVGILIGIILVIVLALSFT
jgi:hypothetical protein